MRYTVEVVDTGVGVGGVYGLEVASETGQTVVYREMTSVVTLPILDGQSVTVAAQEVIVYTDVV